MFIDRQAELGQLEKHYQSGRGDLFVLYGRRRVGKTELLRVFCQGKPHIYFIATLSADGEQLAAFSQQVWGFTRDETPAGFTFPSWEAAFNALAELPGRPLVVLDEFTYLISGNKALPSILQKVWDSRLKDAGVMLVLCGSYIGMMESEVLGHRAPLYGRRTGSTLLQPLGLPAAAQFFPQADSEDQFLSWAVLGGMPYYLQLFGEYRQGLLSGIREHILDPQWGVLFSEPRLLLMEELREPRNYFSILRAIAQGRTRLNEIAQAAGIGAPTSAARYLDILQQMRLVTRRTPATETQPEKSKKGLYQIDDHFLRFWFRYVHPNQAALDLGMADAILEQRIQPDLDHFVATPFEEAARAYVARLARVGELPFMPQRIGAWWDRHAEIDVLALGDGPDGPALLAGECKWSRNPVGVGVLDDLQRKSQRLAGEGTQVYYALFARAGFTEELRVRAEKEGVRLVGVGEMVAGEGL